MRLEHLLSGDSGKTLGSDSAEIQDGDQTKRDALNKNREPVSTVATLYGVPADSAGLSDE